ncbi:MAG: hypothetical protein AAB518_03690, partial [Patescibacteria group bacterium]
MKRLSAFIKRRKWIAAFLLLILVLGIGFAAAKGGNGVTELTVERRMVVQEVTVSGKVKPVESVDLAFEKTGKVSTVTVKVGAKVQPGVRLISLDST